MSDEPTDQEVRITSDDGQPSSRAPASRSGRTLATSGSIETWESVQRSRRESGAIPKGAAPDDVAADSWEFRQRALYHPESIEGRLLRDEAHPDRPELMNRMRDAAQDIWGTEPKLDNLGRPMVLDETPEERAERLAAEQREQDQRPEALEPMKDDDGQPMLPTPAFYEAIDAVQRVDPALHDDAAAQHVNGWLAWGKYYLTNPDQVPDREATIAELRKAWGADFTAKIERAQKYLQGFRHSSAIAEAIDSGVGNRADFVRMIVAAAEHALEHPATPIDPTSVRATEDDATAKLERRRRRMGRSNRVLFTV